MKLDTISFGKSFAPRFLNKAIHTIDKATLAIVVVCWGGSLFLMLFALYTINLSVTAKRQAITAAASEPSLPSMATRAAEEKDMKPLVERLKKRFSDINFSLERDQTLTVSAVDAGKFRLWLTVLSYIDTISPQFRWQLKEFCVGAQCSAATPMRAVLTAERISFSAPSNKIE